MASEIGILDLKIKNATLSGLPAIEVIYNIPAIEAIYNKTYGNERLQKLEIWAIKNNKTYDITFSALESKFRDYSPIVESIVKSLIIKGKETNNQTLNPILNFRTYQNHDIMISYPSDWQITQSHNKQGETIIVQIPNQKNLHGMRQPLLWQLI